MKEIEDLENYKYIEYNIPKYGDYMYEKKDMRESNPYIVIEVVKDNYNLLLNQSQKEKYYIYKVFGLSKESGFREFKFSKEKTISSRKLRKNSKKEIDLKELIINKEKSKL